MSKSKFTISDAARRVNRNRATISRHIKAQKLSYEVDNEGRKLIDASELIRVYGDDFSPEGEGGGKNDTPQSNPSSNHAGHDQLIAELKSRVEHLESTNSQLQQTLAKALDIPPLLEDRKAKETAWQATLDATVAKVVEQTEKQIAALQTKHDEEHDRREKELVSLKRALKAERQKSPWQKLFGSGSRGGR